MGLSRSVRNTKGSKKAKRRGQKQNDARNRFMSAEERAIALDMYHKQKMRPSLIAKDLGRDKSSITRAIFKKHLYKKGVGRKKAITPKMVSKLSAKAKAMVKKADGEYEVTVTMIKKACRVKACNKTVLREFHKRGIYFRRLREKPVLTAADKKDRLRFATEYKGKPKSWWAKKVDAFIDNKHWAVCLNRTTRKVMAQRTVRGAFRARGDGLGEGYTKRAKVLKVGLKTCTVSAAISGSKVVMWKEIKGKWTGQKAADVYKESLKPALSKMRKTKGAHLILEDNDPTGWKSKKGVLVKKESKLKVLEIPRRSPDLNPCDYGLWKEVDKRMRKQEAKFSKEKKETRAEHVKRLTRTANRLPKKFLEKLTGDMSRRCQRLFKAKGGHFEEGGKPTKAESKQ
jgi:hypothetical protein